MTLKVGTDGAYGIEDDLRGEMDFHAVMPYVKPYSQMNDVVAEPLHLPTGANWVTLDGRYGAERMWLIDAVQAREMVAGVSLRINTHDVFIARHPLATVTAYRIVASVNKSPYGIEVVQ